MLQNVTKDKQKHLICSWRQAESLCRNIFMHICGFHIAFLYLLIKTSCVSDLVPVANLKPSIHVFPQTVCVSVCVCVQFHFLPCLTLQMGELKLTDVLSVSFPGHQAVSRGNQQVDQSAWSVSVVQGTGRQVSHGSQV